MIVKSNAVEMTAKSTMQTKVEVVNGSVLTNVKTGEKMGVEKSFSQIFSDTKLNSLCEENFAPGYNKNGLPNDETADVKADNAGSVANLKERESINKALAQLRMYLFRLRNEILEFLNGKSRFGYDGKLMDISTDGMMSGQNLNVWRRTDYVSYTYTEQETMSFETTGKVVTADGRSIDFNVEIAMSREFSQKFESVSSGVEVIMTDPLVISLDSNPIGVSDQKWKFDIDADGKVDEISLLSKGAGFLVYDKNENGVIDDGSEMFGSASGNGFADLMKYDLDGNGWIDEADEIYNKLSVWIKDDAGNDKLIGLKAAEVGAIYLGNVRTEFALKSIEDNSYNAQIRNSGIYLSETGLAKSIQQLDMVKSLVG